MLEKERSDIVTIREQLRDFAKWAGILGWITLISGGINALFGLTAFIIGAVPGIISIILGLKLLEAKKHAKVLVDTDGADENEMYLLIKEITSYFKIQGIMTIIAIVLVIVIFILMIFGIFALSAMDYSQLTVSALPILNL